MLFFVQKIPMQIFCGIISNESESFIRNDIDNDTMGDEKILQQSTAENYFRRIAILELVKGYRVPF